MRGGEFLVQDRTRLAAEQIKSGCVVSAGARAKQSAYIHVTVIDASDADILVRGNVHFEVGGEIHIARMGLEAEPAPTVFRGLCAASAGANDAFAEIFFVRARTVLEFTALALEFIRLCLIEQVTRLAVRGPGEAA